MQNWPKQLGGLQHWQTQEKNWGDSFVLLYLQLSWQVCRLFSESHKRKKHPQVLLGTVLDS
jgi:hypothetical protein